MVFCLHRTAKFFSVLLHQLRNVASFAFENVLSGGIKCSFMWVDNSRPLVEFLLGGSTLVLREEGVI